MPSILKERITEDMKLAMKAKDASRLSVIRLITSAIKQREVDERIELNDLDIATILNKMIKQRRDSISQYTTANRQDLVDQEAYEITLIEPYLPAPFTEAELKSLIDKAIQETGAKTSAELGKVMGILKPQLQGRADLAVVTQRLKECLASPNPS
jgi:uncharacterized protein YqeY